MERKEFLKETGSASVAIEPVNIKNENIFSNGHAYPEASLNANGTGAYSSFLEVGSLGNGTGITHTEKEISKEFVLGQNYPNPFASETEIPFILFRPAEVMLEIWSLDGNKLVTIPPRTFDAGPNAISVKLDQLHLAKGSYVYQLVVTNGQGVFRRYKMMAGYK